MADSNIAITAGAGVNVDTYQQAGGDHQQVVRLAKGTAKTNNTWTIATTASTSQIAADASRVGLIMINNGTGRVYLRWDTTAPTTTVYDMFLEAGDRYEMPDYAMQLVISVLGQFAGGTLNSTLFTNA